MNEEVKKKFPKAYDLMMSYFKLEYNEKYGTLQLKGHPLSSWHPRGLYDFFAHYKIYFGLNPILVNRFELRVYQQCPEKGHENFLNCIYCGEFESQSRAEDIGFPKAFEILEKRL